MDFLIFRLVFDILSAAFYRAGNYMSAMCFWIIFLSTSRLMHQKKKKSCQIRSKNYRKIHRERHFDFLGLKFCKTLYLRVENTQVENFQPILKTRFVNLELSTQNYPFYFSNCFFTRKKGYSYDLKLKEVCSTKLKKKNFFVKFIRVVNFFNSGGFSRIVRECQSVKSAHSMHKLSYHNFSTSLIEDVSFFIYIIEIINELT